jgi:hypothetical protein
LKTENLPEKFDWILIFGIFLTYRLSSFWVLTWNMRVKRILNEITSLAKVGVRLFGLFGFESNSKNLWIFSSFSLNNGQKQCSFELRTKYSDNKNCCTYIHKIVASYFWLNFELIICPKILNNSFFLFSREPTQQNPHSYERCKNLKCV